MEGLKEFLTSTRFSLFGYIVAIVYFFAGVVFVGITSKLRLNERRTFLCDFSGAQPADKLFLQAQCFDKYEQHYNSPLPLYVFVLLNFTTVIVVCLVYSWCCVKSRVDKLQAAVIPDAENPRPRPRVETRCIFFLYFLHLVARLSLGIIFAVLQNFMFYSGGFQVAFVCVSLNGTKSASSAKSEPITYCHNSVASEKGTCALLVLAVNVIFAFLVFGEIVYLVVRAFRRSKFASDSEFCANYFFHQSVTALTPVCSRQRMKRRILQETEFLEPLIHCGKESANKRVSLDEIFLDVIIYTGRATDEFLRECKRHLIYDFYLKPESKKGSVEIKTRKELFLANEDADNPRKILIVGRPGIGKSLLCRKLLRDWSKGELFRNISERFKYAFLFQFRSFYAETTEKISLWQLFNRAACMDGPVDHGLFQELLDNPETILLVFDGLDEFRDQGSCTANEAARFGNSPTEEMPVSALFVKLLQGKLLPDVTVVTSCRPTALESVEVSHFERTVEIMGFTEEKAYKYVNKYCQGDGHTAARIWEHLSSNLHLLSLCYIPVNCRIFCYFLKELIKPSPPDAGSVILPTRLTDVYLGALRLFVFSHHPEFRDKPFRGNESFSDSVEKTLTDLGSLARRGIEEGRLIFDKEEVAGMTNCGLLTQLPDARLSPVEFKQRFSFIHLTLQEFLAAREISKMDPAELKIFITSNAEDPKWQLVIQFVAGLIHGKKMEAIEGIVSCLHDSLLSQSPSRPSRRKALLMMNCLYEYNDEATVKRVASMLKQNRDFHGFIQLWNCNVTPADCTAIVYFLKHIEPLNYYLELTCNSLGDGGCKELSKLLKEGGPVKLVIPENNITDQGLIALVEAISADSCKLKKLNLVKNTSITPEALGLLCESLKERSCKLTHLNLGGLQLTDNVLTQLCESLQHVNSSLTYLKMTNDDFWTDALILKLCETLRHPNCQLTAIRISGHKITNQGVHYFCEALECKHCKLTLLNLTSNRITAVVLPNLCKAVKHQNCKLSTLHITSWNINNRSKQKLEDALEAAISVRKQAPKELEPSISFRETSHKLEFFHAVHF